MTKSGSAIMISVASPSTTGLFGASDFRWKPPDPPGRKRTTRAGETGGRERTT